MGKGDRAFTWQRGDRTAPLPVLEKGVSDLSTAGSRGGTHEVRYLPFVDDIFRLIGKKFHVHGSIARVVSRADVPIFSRSEVIMSTGDEKGSALPAIVYNCRSENNWPMDLALTSTYFPHSRMNFCVLFGCTASIERRILSRLSNAKESVTHPLLLPELFTELEQKRIFDIADDNIAEVERIIYDLDTGGLDGGEEDDEDDEDDDKDGEKAAPARGLRAERRKVWLDMSHLRNSLQNWKSQLAKMVRHVDELSAARFGLSIPVVDGKEGGEWVAETDFRHRQDEPLMRRTAMMLQDRLCIQIEEFEEKIRACSMRLDGMTIATQWSHGDTNVDIATATGRDSSQMRSIALVTMVFLPGTFFATLFSMSFFDWFPGSQNGNDSGGGGKDAGSPRVSGYIWIYFVITIAFTLTTLLLWWYFLVHKRKPSRKSKNRRARVLCSRVCGLPLLWRKFKFSVSYDDEKGAPPS